MLLEFNRAMPTKKVINWRSEFSRQEAETSKRILLATPGEGALALAIKAKDSVTQDWINRELYHGLVEMLGKQICGFRYKNGEPSHYTKIIVALGEAGEWVLLDRLLWTHYRSAIQHYRDLVLLSNAPHISCYSVTPDGILTENERKNAVERAIRELLSLARSVYKKFGNVKRVADTEAALRLLDEGTEIYKVRIGTEKKAVKRKLNNLTDFWKILTQAKKSANPYACLEELLGTLSPDQIIKFDKLLWESLRALNSHDLSAMQMIAQDGVSDDLFLYFRAWIVLQGKSAWDLACKDPVKFALKYDISGDATAEPLLYSASQVYAEKSEGKPLPGREPEGDMTGTPWKSEDDLRHCYSKVWTKYRSTARG